MHAVTPGSSMFVLVLYCCLQRSAWNGEAYNGTAEDVHMSIEFTQFHDWVQDIKNIFVHDLWATEFDKGRCLGPGYVWLRFGHGGPDYLSMHYNRCVHGSAAPGG